MFLAPAINRSTANLDRSVITDTFSLRIPLITPNVKVLNTSQDNPITTALEFAMGAESSSAQDVEQDDKEDVEQDDEGDVEQDDKQDDEQDDEEDDNQDVGLDIELDVELDGESDSVSLDSAAEDMLCTPYGVPLTPEPDPNAFVEFDYEIEMLDFENFQEFDADKEFDMNKFGEDLNTIKDMDFLQFLQ